MTLRFSTLRRLYEPPQAQPTRDQGPPNTDQTGSAPALPLGESGQRHLPAAYLRKKLTAFRPDIKPHPAPPIPQPPHWLSLIDLDRVRFPAGSAVPNRDDVTAWITQLHHSSGVVRKRHSVGADLHFHKASSPRYQFAKHQMNADERTQLTAVLRHLIEGQTLDSQAQNEITDLYLSLQHARLRTHTPEERRDQRLRRVTERIFGGVGLMFLPVSLVLIFSAIELSNENSRNYHRSRRRREYHPAVADMVELLVSADVPQTIKLKIAGEILDRYIRSEKLFRTVDADSILLTLNDGEHPPGVRWGPNPDGPGMRAEKMASLILRGPSTDEQKSRLIEWAREDPNNYNHKNKFVTLNQTLNRLFRKINSLFQQEHRAALTPPPDLAVYNQKRNAADFDRLLKRAETEAKEDPSRKAALYHNIAAILEAITTDPSFADQIFHDSVGGTQNCINNALEYISELATRSRNRTLVRQVESGTMGIEELKEASLSILKLEALEQYIAQVIVPDAIEKNPDVKGRHEPEISQSIKSDLKKILKLPESVNPSSVSYPGKPSNHATYIRQAQSYVTKLVGDRDHQRAFFLTDPLWRESVIALARRQGNKHDIESLKRYTYRLSEYTWEEKVLMDETGKPVKDQELERAVRAWAALNQLYRPRTGQKVLNADGKGNDRYKTEIAAFQDLYDRIEAMEKQFKAAMQDIERQFASHVTDSILSEVAMLPADGSFSPHFSLPETWEAEMGFLDTMSRAAELVELSDVFQKKEKDIEQLNQEIDHFVKSGTFNGAAGAAPSLDEEHRAGLVRSMRDFYRAAPNVSKRFDLRAYLDSLPAKVPGMNLSDEESLLENLGGLRAKVIELQKAKNTLSVNYSSLRKANISVLEQAVAIQENERNALLENLFNPAFSQDFSPLTREQALSLRGELEIFYADPHNWNERFDLGQHIGRILGTDSKDARQQSPGPSINESESNTMRTAAAPKREGDIPAALLALTDRVWAVAQARHEYAMTAQRLAELKAPAAVLTEPHRKASIAKPSALRATPSSRSSSIPGIAFDPRAIAAIGLLNQSLLSQPLEPVNPEEAAMLAEYALDRRAFGADFDLETNAPTQAYVEAMTKNARQARITLERAGLETGEASGAGSNCLIHSMLDGLGITGYANEQLAASLRQALIQRLNENNVELRESEYLDSFGPHPTHLIDLINERFPDADIGVRIYTPLPDGGLHFNNPDSWGGSDGRSRGNAIAVMWVGNHYEPIKVIA